MAPTRKYPVRFLTLLLLGILLVFMAVNTASGSDYEVARSRVEEGVPAFQYMPAQMYENGTGA